MNEQTSYHTSSRNSKFINITLLVFLWSCLILFAIHPSTHVLYNKVFSSTPLYHPLSLLLLLLLLLPAFLLLANLGMKEEDGRFRIGFVGCLIIPVLAFLLIILLIYLRDSIIQSTFQELRDPIGFYLMLIDLMFGSITLVSYFLALLTYVTRNRSLTFGLLVLSFFFLIMNLMGSIGLLGLEIYASNLHGESWNDVAAPFLLLHLFFPALLIYLLFPFFHYTYPFHKKAKTVTKKWTQSS